MRDRWQRDAGTAELIGYYDQPERCQWNFLKQSEIDFLHGEIRKCMDSFDFFARNYAWITTKEGSDVPFRLWEAQELVYETIQLLRSRGHGVKLLIVKARQLGASTLIEAIIAWLEMFNPNFRGLVVSYKPEHASYLFSIILHIYDQLPWWMRPMIGPREYKDFLHLINPDPNSRRVNPGLNSRITVQAASQYAGIAEGQTINAAHVSEFGSYDPDRARKIISGDFRWALPDAPNTFAVLETRVRQASRFTERLWESQIKLGIAATWYPLFLPIYFDKSHFIAPEAGWVPDKPEIEVKTRAAEEWCVCSGCGQIRPAKFGGDLTVGTECQDCKVGTYSPYALQEGQMRWLWQQRLNSEALGEKAVMETKQSLATNPQEAFQYVTETIFSKAARDYVSQTVRNEPEQTGGYTGFMSADDKFHAYRKPTKENTSVCYCSGCGTNHSGQPDQFLKVWQLPVKGARYAMGVDPSSGLGGTHDYAVIWVNRIGAVPIPDVHVATFRSNSVSALHLADVANAIGRWYNNAKAIVDYTNLQSCGDRLVQFHRYPNIHRWKNADSLNMVTPRLHWVWNRKNKEDGWIWLDGWLRDKSLIVRDPIFAREIRYYKRHEDGSLGAPQSAEENYDGTDFEQVYDDTISAASMCLMGSHDTDYRRDGQGLPADDKGLKGTNDWLLTCLSCGRTWKRDVYNATERCPFEGCKGLFVRWHHTKADEPESNFKFEDMATDPTADGSSHFGQCQDLIF